MQSGTLVRILKDENSANSILKSPLDLGEMQEKRCLTKEMV